LCKDRTALANTFDAIITKIYPDPMAGTIYENDSLLLRLKTASPEATHAALMKGIVANFKAQMRGDAPITRELRDGNLYLLDLLEGMLPGEFELERGFKS
jgi:hypothetical protein